MVDVLPIKLRSIIITEDISKEEEFKNINEVEDALKLLPQSDPKIDFEKDEVP